MSEHVHISTVIPTYNRADRVVEAIDSVLAQTSRCDEVIVVDDGSTDDTPRRLAMFGDAIRVVTQENAGVAAARNRGVAEAAHDWIAFLDSDDVWSPERIERQRTLLARHPEAVLLATDWAWNDSPQQGRLPEQTKAALAEPAGADRNIIALTRLGGHGIWLPTWLVRRDALASAGGFDPAFRIAEDTLVLFRIARRFPIAVVPEVLALRREDRDAVKLSLVGDDAYTRELRGYTLRILDEMEAHAADLDAESQASLHRLHGYFLAREAASLIRVGRYREARSIARSALALKPPTRQKLQALLIALAPAAARPLLRLGEARSAASSTSGASAA